MSDDCRLLNPLARDGASQRTRSPAALAADYVRLDEREPADLLLYAREYAKLLVYYDESNVPAGDWSALLERSPALLPAVILRHEAEPARKAFREARKALEAAPEADWLQKVGALFEPIFKTARMVEEWRGAAVPGLMLERELRQLIESVFGDALGDALAYAGRVRLLGAAVAIPALAFDPVWGPIDPPPPADSALLAAGVGDEAARKDAVFRIEGAFGRMQEGVRRLVAQAEAALREALEKHADHAPHAALFLAFLQLAGVTRDALNSVAGRHLDFHYRDALGLAARAGVPDKVHALFELAKNWRPAAVERDTPLDAGKDGESVKLVYGTDSELVVNRASVDADGLKTVFIERDADGVRSIHAATDADAQTEGEEKRWRTFGGLDAPEAEIGFAVSSPMLFLAEGERVIRLKFHLGVDAPLLKGTRQADVERELKANVKVQATGEKGWIDAPVTSVDIDPGATVVTYQLTLDAAAPPLVAYNPKAHKGTLDTKHPVLRFILDNQGIPGNLLISGRPTILEYSDEIERYAAGAYVRDGGKLYRARIAIEQPGYRPSDHTNVWEPIPYAYPYRYFEQMKLKQLEIGLDVSGIRGLVLENDLGVINPAKPFLPFGPAPRAGSSFLVGSWEAFQKPLTRIDVDLVWDGTPTNKSFTSHYLGYPGIGARNEWLTAKLSVLRSDGWDTVEDNVRLFDDGPAADGYPPARPKNFQLAFTDFRGDAKLPRFERYAAGLPGGFARVSLKKSFLHEQYPIELAEYAKGGASAVAPNPPYAPVVSEIRLSYHAADSINYAAASAKEVEDRSIRLFQLGPFGHQEIAPVRPAPVVKGLSGEATPVPSFRVRAQSETPAEGTLYIGLAGLEPPQNLSLLFQMAEGSEDPELTPQPVSWSYLGDRGWVDFAAAEVLSDATGGLIASGIVQFAVPAAATREATAMPAGRHWLRAAVAQRSDAIPKAIALHAQAVRASFRDRGNDPAHLERPLPAGVIGKLLERNAAIKSVGQPYASFGGRAPENDAQFRIRVSERLRHKRRAVSVFDYERQVLERFPEVYKVRCLNHTSREDEFSPGHVRLVVVPDLRNRNAVDPLHPRLSAARLAAIREYMRGLATDFATIHVTNPDYEDIRVRFNVRFGKGRDKGYYTGVLAADIVRFLSPWLYDDARDLGFGGRVHRSSILNFIDKREYVDFVVDFEMDHMVGSVVRRNVEEALATRSSAALVSARAQAHEIGDRTSSCEDQAGLDDAAPGAPPPAPGAPAPLGPAGQRFLGNAHTRELHDLARITANCRIDDIWVDRRFYVSRVEDALALRYDYCAYCFGKGLSQR